MRHLRARAARSTAVGFLATPTLAGAFLACGAAHPTPASQAAAVAAPAPPTPAAPAPAPTRVTVIPTWFAPFSAGTERDGAMDVYLGSLRLAVGPQDVRWGEGEFADGVDVAARGANGWVFLTYDGLFARSETFLGPARRLGEIGHAFRGTRPSAGRLATLTEDGAVLSTDGAGPPTTGAAPTGGVPWAVTFSDPQHGLFVSLGGGLYATDDAGASWHAVDLGGEAAYDVREFEGQRVAFTSAGPRAVAPDGSLSPSRAPLPNVLRAEQVTPDEVIHRIEPALLVRFADDQVSRLDGRPLAVRRPDGTRLFQSGRRGVVAVDPVRGTIVRESPDALPEHCSLQAWGPVVAAECYEPTATYRSEDGFTYEPIAPLGSFSTEFSDDGRHALRSGLCPPREGEAGGEHEFYEGVAFCAVLDGRNDRHTVRLPGTGADVFALHGARALVRTFVGETETALFVLDTDRGTSERIAFDPAESLPEGTGPIAAHWLPDGAVVVVLAPGLERYASMSEPPSAGLRFAIGRPDGVLHTQPLPASALAADFVDARRGVVAGPNAATVFRTVDGGTTWTPLPVPLDGSPETLRLADVRHGERPRVYCADEDCWVGRRLHVRGWGALRPAEGPRVLAAQTPLPDRAETPAPDSTRPPTFECTAEGGSEVRGRARRSHGAGGAGGETAGNGAAETGEAPSGPNEPRRVSVGGGATWGEVEVRPDGGRLTLVARWSGEDERGTFRAQSRAGMIDLAEDERETDEHRAMFILRGATREAMMFQRCVPGASSRMACRLLWARANNPVHGVPELAEFARAVRDVGPAGVGPVLPLPDGGMLAQWSVEQFGPLLERVVRLSPEGRVVAFRSVALESRILRGDVPGLYVAGNRVGFVAPARPGQPRAVTLLDGTSAEPVVIPPPSEVTMCGAPAPAAARVALYATGEYAAIREGSWGEPVAVYEIAGGRVCLRSLEYWAAPSPAAARWARETPVVPFRMVAGAHGLRAVAVPAGRRTSLRCAPFR